MNSAVVSKFALAALGATYLCACSADHSQYYPLEKGAEWTYQYRFNFPRGVESVKVSEEIAVGGVQGYKLTGPMGTSRLAWKGNRLIAEELAGTRFTPPLPLLVPGAKDKVAEWTGTMQLKGAPIPATAVLRQTATSYTVSERKYPAIKCSLSLGSKDVQVETVSIYAEGLGLVSQEENRNSLFYGSLEFLSGP